MEDFSYKSDFFFEIVEGVESLLEGPINKTKEEEFNRLALMGFKYQFHNNEVYRNISKEVFNLRGPDEITDYRNIPPVPTEFFKKQELISFPSELKDASRLFETSGTSGRRDENGNRLPQGKIWRDPVTLKLYDKSMLKTTKEFLFLDKKRIKTYFLASPPEDIPTSPIGYNLSKKARSFSKGEEKYLFKNGIFQNEELVEYLEEDERNGEEVALIGPSFAFVNFFDYCRERGINFSLNPDSRIADGGGYKGFSREPSRQEFIELVEEITKIPPENVVNLYACSETPSLNYENSLRNSVLGIDEERFMPQLPWKRTLVYDVDSLPELHPVNSGEKGILVHFDLVDVGNVLGIITDDVGYHVKDGFRIMGRGDEEVEKKYNEVMERFGVALK